MVELTDSAPYKGPFAELFTLPHPPPYKAGFETYLSPFTYRYGTDEMRRLWSQNNFWMKVRDLQVYDTEVLEETGLVTPEELRDLIAHQDKLSVERIFQFERDPKVGTGHDLVAAVAEYYEHARLGGRKLQVDKTSEDLFSNVEVELVHDGFDLIRGKLVRTLEGFAGQIENYKDLVCMGYTHLQAAEPTTMGYRFAKYAQDLWIDLQFMDVVRGLVKGKGLKGAVGTSASFVDSLEGTGMSANEREWRVMRMIGTDYVTISDQTAPRKFLFLTECALASIGQSLHRFAFDLQILQSSFVDEVTEPRRKGQKSSSAMPHKQNPIISENIDSLTEVLPGALFSSWMTGAFISLERTLRDSAGKRDWLPESFLIVDEALTRAERVVKGMEVHENAVLANLRKFAPYLATEILMGRLVDAGMDRMEAYEILYEHASNARDAVRSGRKNPMQAIVLGDEKVTALLGRNGVNRAFRDVFHHVGNAPDKCMQFLNEDLYPSIR